MHGLASLEQNLLDKFKIWIKTQLALMEMLLQRVLEKCEYVKDAALPDIL